MYDVSSNERLGRVREHIRHGEQPHTRPKHFAKRKNEINRHMGVPSGSITHVPAPCKRGSSRRRIIIKVCVITFLEWIKTRALLRTDLCLGLRNVCSLLPGLQVETRVDDDEYSKVTLSHCAFSRTVMT